MNADTLLVALIVAGAAGWIGARAVGRLRGLSRSLKTKRGTGCAGCTLCEQGRSTACEPNPRGNSPARS